MRERPSHVALHAERWANTDWVFASSKRCRFFWSKKIFIRARCKINISIWTCKEKKTEILFHFHNNTHTHKQQLYRASYLPPALTAKFNETYTLQRLQSSVPQLMRFCLKTMSWAFLKPLFQLVQRADMLHPRGSQPCLCTNDVFMTLLSAQSVKTYFEVLHN